MSFSTGGQSWGSDNEPNVMNAVCKSWKKHFLQALHFPLSYLQIKIFSNFIRPLEGVLYMYKLGRILKQSWTSPRK